MGLYIGFSDWTDIAHITGLQTALNAKAPLASPTFTGTVGGITAAMVGASAPGHTHVAANVTDFSTAALAAVTYATITGKPATFAPTIGATASTAVAGNDIRLTNARTPTAHTHLWADTTDKPATFAPIIGATATTAVAGNDGRLTDARTPVAHNHVAANVTDFSSAALLAVTFASLTGKPTTYPPTLGTVGGTAAAGDDARLTDARTPLAHSHLTSDVTGLDTALTSKLDASGGTYESSSDVTAARALIDPAGRFSSRSAGPSESVQLSSHLSGGTLILSSSGVGLGDQGLVANAGGITFGAASAGTIRGTSPSNGLQLVSESKLTLTSNLSAAVGGGVKVINTSFSIETPGEVALSETTTAGFRVGPINAANLVMDSNEFQARNNGAASSLFINTSGGNVTLGTAASTVYIPGTLLLDDTGWVAITVNGTFAANGTPSVRRIGKMLYFKDGFTNAGMAANGNYVAGTIPTGYRPVGTKYGVAGANTAAGTARCVIGSDGSLTISTNAALGTYFRLDMISIPMD